MPLFEYRCNRCGGVTEVLVRQHGSEGSRTQCAYCSSTDTERMVSRFHAMSGRAPKYSDELREKALPFLKSRPGTRRLLAEGGESEESKVFNLTERIGERVDAALDRHVFRNL